MDPGTRFFTRWLTTASGDARLFGGGSSFRDDTWEWDALRGSRNRPPRVLQPAYMHAMSTTLLGGASCSSESWQLWTSRRHVGMGWHHMDPKPVSRSPSARLVPECLRPRPGRLVLFGATTTTVARYMEYKDECGSNFIDDEDYGSFCSPLGAPAMRVSLPGGPGTPYAYSNSPSEFSGPERTLLSLIPEQGFSPLIVADTIEVNGVDSGLGSYSDQPGVPRSCTTSPSNRTSLLYPPMT